MGLRGYYYLQIRKPRNNLNNQHWFPRRLNRMLRHCRIHKGHSLLWNTEFRWKDGTSEAIHCIWLKGLRLFKWDRPKDNLEYKHKL